MSTLRKIKILPGIPRTRLKDSSYHIYGRRTTENATCDLLGLRESTPPFKAAIVGTFESMEDVVTPYFRERSARGDIIISPMQKIKDTHTATGDYGRAQAVQPVVCSGVSYTAIENWYGPWLHWRVAGQPANGSVLTKSLLLPDADISSAVSVASTAAWSNASAHNADVLTDIAEIRSTLSMLRDPLKTTSTLLRNIKSKQGRARNLTGRAAADYFNSQWLQYRYGIRPLVNSVQGVVKALKGNREKRRSTYRGSYSLSASSLSTGTHVGMATTNDYSTAYTDTLSVRTGMIIEELITLADSLGVDASGMLALPWELVPYSFVADWFANTNKFLGAIVPYLTKNSLGGWVTQLREVKVEFKATATRATNPSTYTILQPCTEHRTSTFLTKTRNVGLPSPVLAWKPQALSMVLDDLRIADAFALTANLFFSTFKR